MPHIRAEEVAEKRKQVKAAFPNWKFSITRRHFTGIDVTILEADIDLKLNNDRGNESVNYFYIADHYKEKPEAAKALQRIYEIINEGNRTVTHDGDYGAIPQFYVSIRVGEYDKPFKLIEKKSEVPVKSNEPIIAGTIQLVDYSEKAIAIIGDTKPIKEKLKELGGRFNFGLKCGAGWIFPKTKEQAVREALSL